MNPGKHAARQQTSVSALNKIILRLQELKAQTVATAAGLASLAEQQTQTALLTTIDTNIADIEVLLAKGNLQILEQEATDLVKTFAYLDAGAADERVSTIIYTSPVDFPAITVTKTFVYAGIAGAYRVSTITLS